MKNALYLLIILFCIAFQSCETEIPERDNTAPEFTFKITGDGFDHTFDQNTDFANIQLNLKHDAEYNFIYTGSDQGGVKLIQWQLPGSDYIEFDDVIPSPWTDTSISPINRIIEWEGDASNPLTGNILAGTFESNSPDGTTSIAFRFLISDFGGESGAENTVSRELTILIADHSTEIVNL